MDKEEKQKFYVVGDGKSEEVSEEVFKKEMREEKEKNMEAKMEKKVKKIQHGIPEINKRKETLFELMKYFYGDFKWNQDLNSVPNPNKWIQKAIDCLEQAIYEAGVIEVNSV